jgi:hypothetical protein
MRRVCGVRSRMSLVYFLGAGEAFKRRVRVGVRDVVEKRRDDQDDNENRAFHFTQPSLKCIFVGDSGARQFGLDGVTDKV